MYREKPLSFYVFTASGATFKRINQLTSAGGVVHNDVIMHASGWLICMMFFDSSYIFVILPPFNISLSPICR